MSNDTYKIEAVKTADDFLSVGVGNITPIERARTAERLSVLQSEFVLFNHGMIFTETKMDSDPVQEFANRTQDSEAIFFLQYDRPLLVGMRDRFWNSVIFACKKKLWPDLKLILNNLIFKETTGRVYSCFVHDVYLPDPYLWDGNKSGIKHTSEQWGELCENADRGLNGDARYTNVYFPSRPLPAKIHIIGVSGPIRLAFIKSGLFPKAVYDEPEKEVLILQEALKNHVA